MHVVYISSLPIVAKCRGINNAKQDIKRERQGSYQPFVQFICLTHQVAVLITNRWWGARRTYVGVRLSASPDGRPWRRHRRPARSAHVDRVRAVGGTATATGVMSSRRLVPLYLPPHPHARAGGRDAGWRMNNARGRGRGRGVFKSSIVSCWKYWTRANWNSWRKFFMCARYFATAITKQSSRRLVPANSWKRYGVVYISTDGGSDFQAWAKSIPKGITHNDNAVRLLPCLSSPPECVRKRLYGTL